MKSNPMAIWYTWGEWGANADGSHAVWPGSYAGLNIPDIVKRVKDAGATTLVWALSWDSYYIAAPIASVDDVMSGRTSTTDYLGQLLDEAQDQGIRVMFYYHLGHGNNPNLDWWNNFWTVPGGNDARKEAPMNKWINIITEIGNRYGSKLAGWYFDDGVVYYPSPFRMLTEAARAGNADRMVSFNSFTMPRFTDYEDFYFGEAYGNAGTATNILNGLFTSGPHKGEQATQNFPTESGDWGVLRKLGDYSLNTTMSDSDFKAIAQRALGRHQFMAYNFRMLEDGTMSQTSLDRFTQAANQVSDPYMINDSSSGISYTGTSWGNGSNRYQNQEDDLHWTSHNGDYAEFTFTGTGIGLFSEKASDRGNVDIYIDNVFQQTVDTYNATTIPRTEIYKNLSLSNGSHTIKMVKQSGSWITLDAFRVYSDTVINDTDTNIAYSANWGYGTGRSGCLNTDLHYTSVNNGYAEFTFKGTGVGFITEVGTDRGEADVYIDGVYNSTVDSYSPTWQQQQELFTITGLLYGTHKIKVVKKSGSWIAVDGFKTYN